MLSVIIYGPPASGKSLRAEEIRKLYNLEIIVDPWFPDDLIPEDSLCLSQVNPTDERRGWHKGAMVFPINDILAILP